MTYLSSKKTEKLIPAVNICREEAKTTGVYYIESDQRQELPLQTELTITISIKSM